MLNKRLEERKIVLEPTPAAMDWLGQSGYDPMYGARPLKRLIQREIENTLSLEMLEGKFHDGDHIIIDVADENLVFRKGASEADSTHNNHAEEKVAAGS